MSRAQTYSDYLHLHALPQGEESLFGTADLWGGGPLGDVEVLALVVGLFTLVTSSLTLRWWVRRRTAPV